jgi:serine/threonine protein kinase/WD40 repeat protein
MISKTLAHYRILSKLGEGGMGEVWRARDTNLDREVAIKILPETYAADADRLKRFEREAKLLASLNHPNIATVYGLHEADGVHFIAMELVPGTTLAARLARGALPVGETMAMARQIAEALEAAHDSGVIHRDLKPANVMVRDDGTLKVLDFGLAKSSGPRPGTADGSAATAMLVDGTVDGAILGTTAYMSPEQARGQAVDQRTDIWALGCLLFECLTGDKAFPGQTISDSVAAVLTVEPDWTKLPAEAPETLRRLIRRCLAKDPSRRLHSMADARLEIEEAQREPDVIPDRSRPAIRGRPSLPVIALAILAVVIAGLSLFRHRTGNPEDTISYQRLTHERGFLTGARFAVDGKTVVYSGAWEGDKSRPSLRRLDSPVAIDLQPSNSRVLAVSARGEIAVLLPKASGSLLSRLNDGTLATVLLTGGTPRPLLENVVAMDWDPAGEQMAVVRMVGNRFRLEYPVGQVLYETNGSITFPRVSPAGDLVAFLDHPLPANNRGYVAVVAPGGERRILTSELENMSGLAWSPDGREIWFSGADERDAALFAVSRSGRMRVLRRIPDEVELFDVSRDGRILATLYLDDLSIAALAPRDSVEREFKWLTESFVTDLSADGKEFLFSERSLSDVLSYEAWLWRVDDQDPVRLGPGFPFELSPDGKWVLAHHASLNAPLTMLPTGAGEARELSNDLGALWACWIPGDRGVVFAASGPEGEVRLYRQGIGGGATRPVSDEAVKVSGLRPCRVSPDGNLVAAIGVDGLIRIFPIDGGEARAVPGTEEGEVPLGWTTDGRRLYVGQWTYCIPARAYLLDIETGERRLWRELSPTDPAGVRGIVSLVPTPDGRGYAYSYFRGLETLYLISGLD